MPLGPMLPMSYAPAQYVPASTTAVSCGVAPAGVFTVRLKSQSMPVAARTPMPRPRTIVGEGLVLPSVTLTVPDCAATNVRIAVPFCAIEPFSVSDVGDVTVGAVAVVVLLLLHAAQNAANASSPTVGHFMRVRNSLCDKFVTLGPRSPRHPPHCTMTHMTPARFAMFGLLLLAAGCSNNATTPTPTSTTTPTPVTTPTISENFASTVPVGGAAFYSFNIVANGTVNVTLNSVGGTGVPATVQLGLGIGTPAGVDCTVTSAVTAAAGTAAQLTGTFGPGLFCLRVYDVGNLFGPAAFRATIAHS